MTKRLNIGVDVDGVLSNFTKAARTLCKEMFDGRPDDSLIQTSWAFDSLGISKQEENIMWRKIDSLENWWMGNERMPDTSLLTNLCMAHRVIFITNRKDGLGWPIEVQTAEWLRRNFWLHNPNVVISDDKGAVAKGLKLDYFLDDRTKNIMDVVRDYPQCTSVLRADTYNTECTHPIRVSTFNEFAARLLGENPYLTEERTCHSRCV